MAEAFVKTVQGLQTSLNTAKAETETLRRRIASMEKERADQEASRCSRESTVAEEIGKGKWAEQLAERRRIELELVRAAMNKQDEELNSLKRSKDESEARWKTTRQANTAQLAALAGALALRSAAAYDLPAASAPFLRGAPSHPGLGGPAGAADNLAFLAAASATSSAAPATAALRAAAAAALASSAATPGAASGSNVPGRAASPALAQLTANLRLLVEAAPPAKGALAAVHAAAADAAAAAAAAGHDENDASTAFAASAAGGRSGGGSVPLSAGKARGGGPRPGYHHHSHDPASPTPAPSVPSPPPVGGHAVAGPHDAIVRKETLADLVYSHAQLAAAAVGYEAALTLYDSCVRQSDRRLADVLASEWQVRADRAGGVPGPALVCAVPELAGVEARLRDVVANAWGLLWGLHAPGGPQQRAGGADSAGAAALPPGAGADTLSAPPADFAPGAADVRDWEPGSVLVPQLQCSDPSAVFDIVAAFCEHQQQSADRDGADDSHTAPRGARTHRRGQQAAAAGPVPRLLLRTLLDPFTGFQMGAPTPAPSVHGGAASSTGGGGCSSGSVAASSADAGAGAGENEGDGLHGPAPSPPRSVPGTGHQLPLQQPQPQPQHGAMDEESEGGEAAGDEQQRMEELDAGSDEGTAQAALVEDEGAAAVEAEAEQPEREHTVDVSGAQQAAGCGAAGAAASGARRGWSWPDAAGCYDEW